ncbi:hypothetical protein DAI22_01g215600 [Oryza sativa Japonica Group]|jgi:hypothetical protein|nr:hypothetical protein DAI22_01g215600 [Oryza sativa Japonica Group]
MAPATYNPPASAGQFFLSFKNLSRSPNNGERQVSKMHFFFSLFFSLSFFPFVYMLVASNCNSTLPSTKYATLTTEFISPDKGK